MMGMLREKLLEDFKYLDIDIDLTDLDTRLISNEDLKMKLG